MASAALVVACTGPQSALDPAGTQASAIAELWWVLAAVAVVVWLLVMAIAAWAWRRAAPGDPSGPVVHSPAPRAARWLIVGGGVVVPVVVLAVLLGYGLWLMPRLRPVLPETALRVEVSGEQWWWRVRYALPDGRAVEAANQIHLPVGEPVEFVLTSPDVIHSFWVPALGGKMDMIPGRSNRLVLEATRTGAFTGACAEYCGSAHALMKLDVVVQPREDFEAWLAIQVRSAASASGALATRGQALFLATGCGACHTVRGTPADGVVGPDLTHVGSRMALGAGVLPTDAEAFARWVGHAPRIKPGVRMPGFAMLPAEDLAAMAAWLEQLQ